MQWKSKIITGNAGKAKKCREVEAGCQTDSSWWAWLIVLKSNI